MRMNALCLLGTLSAAAILAACAERRTYNDEVTTSSYDRDRGYTSGWSSGSYVAQTNDGNYQSNSTSYQTGSATYGGYQSGTTGGYRNNNNLDSTNRVSGYGASDSFNTGTSSSQTTYGTSNNGLNNSTYGNGTNNQPYGGTDLNNNNTYGNGTYGTQPSTGNGTYGSQPATGTTGGYGNGTYGTGATTGGGYGNGAYEKSGTLGSSTWRSVTSGVVTFHPIEGNTCKGNVRFVSSGRALHVSGDLEGLKPNQKVAFRIQEFGDCDASGQNFGGSTTGTTTTYGNGSNVNGTGSVTTGTQNGTTVSTTGTMHNDMAGMRRFGDVVTLESDASGRLHIDQDINDVTLVDGDNAILGRSVVLETVGDSTMSSSDTNSMSTGTGTRIACGVIGIGKSETR